MCRIPGESNLEFSVKKYKMFPGDIRGTIPLLISEGRQPIKVSEVLQERINVFRNNAPEFVVKSWLNNKLYTGNIIVYNPNGSLKIIDPQYNFFVEPNSPTLEYNLVLSKDKERAQKIYEDLPGKEFSYEKILELREVHWSESEQSFVYDPIWGELVQDINLLKNYYRFVSQIKEKETPINHLGLRTHPAENYEIHPIAISCLKNCNGGLETYIPATYNQLIGVYN